MAGRSGSDQLRRMAIIPLKWPTRRSGCFQGAGLFPATTSGHRSPEHLRMAAQGLAERDPSSMSSRTWAMARFRGDGGILEEDVQGIPQGRPAFRRSAGVW